MLNQITLHFGSDSYADPLEINLMPVTIFVGPNNSGKSLALFEIDRICSEGFAHPKKVIKDIKLKKWTVDEFVQLIDEISVPDNKLPGEEWTNLSRISSPNGAKTQLVERAHIVRVSQNLEQQFSFFCQTFLKLWVSRLDGTTRIGLVSGQNVTDILEPAKSILDILFRDRERRLSVRRVVKEAFSKSLVIDPTPISSFRIRLAERDPIDDFEELSLNESARAYYQSAQEIERFSDGVKAFIGTLIALIANQSKIELIDEPEAFLHPPLAQRLGREISSIARNEGKQLFVATHSASFVMGCVQSGVPANIVRLTYQNQVPTARLLDNQKLVKLMRHPLLRSTGVLNALFHEYVIVTEGNSDRAFYQEINERLLNYDSPRGIADCLFLNAVNKQTVWDIIKPLRELGIAAAAIVDIDIIKNGGKEWVKVLEASHIPEGMRKAFQDWRLSVYTSFENLEMKRGGGINLLSSGDKEAAIQLFNNLAEYGAFVVDRGELEAWLPQLQISKPPHSSDWLIEAFERMGDDPQSAEYLRPSDGDVWDFIAKIKIWLSNPNRKGIPKS